MELTNSVPNTMEIFADQLCRDAGVTFRGIQRGYGITPSLILFDDRHGSTLGIELRFASVNKIYNKLRESDAAWRKAVR